MSTTPPEDLARIIDYVAEELSREETVETERWIEEDEGRKELVAYLRRSQQAHLEVLTEEFQADRVVRRLNEALIRQAAQGQVNPSHVMQARRHFRSSRRSMGPRWERWSLRRYAIFLAGAVCVATAAGIITRASRDWATAPPTSYSTAAGHRSALTLRDGTRIQLAPASRLEIDAGFGALHRTVRLSGEARFDVRETGATPFVVLTGGVSTRVLGTVFVVRRYGHDAAEVAVERGRVMTRGGMSTVIVDAGARARATDSIAALSSAVTPTQYTDWNRGRLVFTDVSVPELLASLERWYGYRFRLRDSTVAHKNISAIFDLSNPMEMMVIIKDVLDVTMTFDGKTVTLTPRRKSSSVSRRRLRSDTFTPSMEMGK